MQKVFLACLIAVLLSIPVFVLAEDTQTVAVMVDESGKFVSGAQKGQIDPDLYYESPKVAVQASVASSFNFASLNVLAAFITSIAVKRFVIMFCSLLVAIGFITLGRENTVNLR